MQLDDLLNEWIEAIDGDLAAPIEAAKFVTHVRAEHPSALHEWLDARAEVFVADRISRILSSARARAQHRRGASVFAASVFAASVDAAAMDGRTIEPLEARYVVNDANTRRPLRMMSAEDLEFAASWHDSLASSNAFEAAFLRALAKRVANAGAATVGDVLTDDDVLGIRHDIATPAVA